MASASVRWRLPDRMAFGPGDRSRWASPGLLVLLAVTALLYLWNLAVSGWGNEYYAAAAQAGTQSWRALLFGSHDAGNAITVDKPPASLWVMGLSGRLFGFGRWSILVPQALLGVGSVALLCAAVRRWSGPGAGLLAGAAFAATPVAALMFRYDNPDALLTFLLIAAAYCTVRAVESTGARWLSPSTGWLAMAGVAIGFAFLTKMMQAFLVLPALVVVFLVAAAGGFWSRIRGLVTAGVAVVVSGGWYVLLVALWPADARPYIGGSTTNSLWELAVGFNGVGRLLGGRGNPGGESGGPSAGAQMGGAFGGETGITRLFRDLMATEVSWLLPAALIGLFAGLWITRRAPRTDRLRAGLILWGGWLWGTGLVFSYMSGVMHPYYTVALAPGIAALAGISVTESWRRRRDLPARIMLALLAAVTGVWAFVLLGRTPDWLPWLRWAILIGVLLAAAVLLGNAGRWRRVATAAAVVVGLLAGLAGTGVYTVATASQPHSGGIPTSGPHGGRMVGPPGGIPHSGAVPGPPLSGQPTTPGGRIGPPGDGRPMPGGHAGPAGTRPRTLGGVPPVGAANDIPDTELEALLRDTDRRWSAATIGSFMASRFELRTGTSIMAIGGFGGRDDAPSLERFERYVADSEIRYFLLEDRSAFRPSRPGGGVEKSVGEQIAEWVQTHYTPRRVGGVIVYDLAEPTGS
ncbi:glycosyltransferase family 39 protein [Nocardia sp. NPDC050710]|uniref:glycosyltransferase family 39 protein n=1 Tax=Nocardia sp. NPDC050710 TaxID=3157220 RepID=UPI0033D24FB6